MKKREDIILGKRIREIRNNLGLDQREFAEKINATVSALSNWENGRNKPKDGTLNKIAELSKIPPVALLYGNYENYVYQLLNEYVENTTTEQNFSLIILTDKNKEVIFKETLDRLKDEYSNLVEDSKEIIFVFEAVLDQHFLNIEFSNKGAINFLLQELTGLLPQLRKYFFKKDSNSNTDKSVYIERENANIELFNQLKAPLIEYIEHLLTIKKQYEEESDKTNKEQQ